MSELNVLNELIFGHSDPMVELQGDVVAADRSVTGEIPLVSDALHPAEALVKAQSDALAKGTGSIANARWDEPLTKEAASGPAAFHKRSDERFQKVVAAVERIFGSHPEECQEIISIAKRMRDEARGAVIAFQHDGEPLNKSEIQSGMQRQFAEVRASCSREEEKQILKAIKALDLSAFFGLLEGVKSRFAAA